MEILYGSLIFVLGAILGSFFNVCIYRIPRNESIVYPASHCSNCKKEIKKYDLIPIISYLIVKGKCRNCGKKISYQYILVELITAIIFTFLYLKYGFSVKFFAYCFLASFLIITSLIDINTRYIYESLSYIGFTGAVLYMIYNYTVYGEIKTYILGGLITGGVIAILALLKVMGWGDIEVILICGLFLGIKLSLVMLFLSFIVGGIIGIIILLSGKRNKDGYTPMAFAPCIALGCVISIFYGENIIRWFIEYYGAI